jgi:hypothetical protein
MTKAVRTEIYKSLRNRAMARKLVAKRAIDISNRPREGDYYVLNKVIEGKDYCDADTEEWVWSIGRRLRDGVILASMKTDLYQNDRFQCLWLR